MELVEKGLDRCNIGHIQLAQGDTDISLKTRVAKANSNKCDLVVSLHANALSGTQWQTKAYGLVVIRHVNCQAKTKALANNCYHHLSKEVDWYSDGATKYGVRKDTDISGFSLYILKHTKAPAILIEYGFMDNWEDVKKMVTDKFQKECAEATVKGICDTLGVKYIAPKTSNSTNSKTLYVKVIHDGDLNVRSVADWNAKPCSTVKKDDVFTVVEKVKAKNGSTSMYKLKSGLYITTSKKYVETYSK